MSAAGGLIGEALTRRHVSKVKVEAGAGSRAEGWPKENAAVGLTGQRLMLFNYTAMDKPKDMVAEYPLDQLASVELEKKKLGVNALRFIFSDGSGVEVECAKLEKTGDFFDAFDRTKGASQSRGSGP